MHSELVSPPGPELALDEVGRRFALASGRPRSAAGCAGGVCQNRAPTSSTWSSTMDVEHINAIGNNIADLTARTADLRGYL